MLLNGFGDGGPCKKSFSMMVHFLELARRNFPWMMPIDHDAAGEGRNEKSRNDE
jgi:hypothetical protein